MKTKAILNFILSALVLLLFILFTAAVKTYDVKPLGPNGSLIGFATINTSFFGNHGENPFLYNVTEMLGYVSMLFAACFGIIGVIQLIKYKSLLKVEHSILFLGVFYIVVIGCYILFEEIIINYRPVLADGLLEASYPSSHTMLVMCIMGTAIIQFNRRLHSTASKLVADFVCCLILGITVIGRLLCGVHWLTDIIGSILLSSALIMFYYSTVKVFDYRKEQLEKEQEEYDIEY